MSSRNRYRQSSIPEPKISKEKNIRFSFEYYDITRDDYCISCWAREQIKLSLERLKDICTKTLNDLNGNRIYHFGEVIWEKTNEKQGFPYSALNTMSPFHFALLGVNGQLARVYGAFSNDTFYIVWFDLHHKIWPSYKRNT